MSDPVAKPTHNAATELSVSDLQTIDPALLAELQNKYGLDIQIRSNSDAINRLLQGLGRPGGIGLIAEFTRGFDRTSPGYDKYYNRDYAVRDPLDEITLPQIDLSKISLEEALKTLSPEQLAMLKKRIQ